MTVRELYLNCKASLDKDNAEFEAKQIVMSVLSLNTTDYLLSKDKPVNVQEIQQCIDYVNSRNNGIPLYYILGECEFYGLPFKVGKGVLIPRSDTEILVDTALNAIRDIKSPRVLDLCSGSGCIAIAIASQRADAAVDAVELMEDAFYYLEKNIALNCLTNVTAIKSDALEFTGQYDLVVCNPPYISYNERLSIEQEVQNEPESALFAKENGLFYYKKICNNFSRSNKKITLAFEIGYKQAKEVSNIMTDCGFKNIEVIKDLCGNDRVVLNQL